MAPQWWYVGYFTSTTEYWNRDNNTSLCDLLCNHAESFTERRQLIPGLTRSCMLANAVRIAMQYRSFLIFTPQPIICVYKIQK